MGILVVQFTETDVVVNVCRALMFVSNNFGGAIQEMVLAEDDINLLALVNRELHKYIDNMEEAKYVKIRKPFSVFLNCYSLAGTDMCSPPQPCHY